MGKIRQLPEAVANQISAGEVVERPASVVKELIENSIDAGSTKILVEIENGGRDKIRVKDNGEGIAEEDLELAFSRYATSKIEKVNDLYSIQTLGFRGEALASIASVARVELKSRTVNSNKGSFLLCKGGEIKEIKPAGVPQGTDIEVTELFYNTPARYKYLKTKQTEFGHISNVVTREALAYPDIQFALKHNSRQVLLTPGSGNLKDAIYAIYGQELVENLIPVDFKDRYIKVHGYVAHPRYYRSSRIYELFFVNKRSVYNNILNKGVEAAYRGLLPPGSYPVVFLFLKLNQILVDVNVHPTKREIKFSRNKIIKDVLEKGIKTALKEVNPSPGFRKKRKKKKPDKYPEQKKLLEVEEGYIDTSIVDKRGNKKEKQNIKHTWMEKKLFKSNNKSYSPIDKKKDRTINVKEPGFNKDDKEQENININKNKENLSRKRSDKNNPIKRVLGQIEQTYIVAEGEDGLYLIDQHNAHERVLHQQITIKYEQQGVRSQSLLVPLNMDLTLEEMEIIKKYKDELTNLGIKIESFGRNSIIVQELPVFLKDRSQKKVIREIIDTLIEEGKKLNRVELIEEMINYMACRGAIKAGVRMENNEMERLVEDLFQTEHPYRCPHGRPIVLHLTLGEIEKSMGRI